MAGDLAAFQGEDAIVIGAGLARKLEVGIGDRVTVVSPQGRVTVFGTVPRLRAYKVAAIFEVGMQEYDSGFVFLPLAAAQLFFQLPDAVSQIEVHLRNPDESDAAAYAIRQALADRPLRIADWQDANSGFFQLVQVQRNVMFLILTLIILVAAFNIVSSPDHAGEGQGARHRHPAHHGRGAGGRSCGSSCCAAPRWAGSGRSPASASGCCSAPISRVSGRG